VPNQYQLVTIRSDGLTRHARQYAPGQRRWIGDTCISHGGSDWRVRERHPIADVGAAFGTGEPDPGDCPGIDRAAAIGADRKPADGTETPQRRTRKRQARFDTAPGYGLVAARATAAMVSVRDRCRWCGQCRGVGPS
jgi:hypothetical protein